MKVSFNSIGRNKKTWETDFPGSVITESQIAKEAKRNGGLMSREVDAEISENGDGGVVLVGGWRPVGTFTITR